MPFFDKIAIKTALAARPSLRRAVIDWIEHVSGLPVPMEERAAFEIGHLDGDSTSAPENFLRHL